MYRWGRDNPPGDVFNASLLGQGAPLRLYFEKPFSHFVILTLPKNSLIYVFCKDRENKIHINWWFIFTMPLVNFCPSPINR